MKLNKSCVKFNGIKANPKKMCVMESSRIFCGLPEETKTRFREAINLTIINKQQEPSNHRSCCLLLFTIVYNKEINMIRRPATTIKLTPEDVINYDDEKLKQQSHSFSGNSSSGYNQNSAGSQESVIQRLQSLKSKDERIGLRSSSRQQ